MRPARKSDDLPAPLAPRIKRNGVFAARSRSLACRMASRLKGERLWPEGDEPPTGWLRLVFQQLTGKSL